VRASGVVIVNVLNQNPSQMSGIQDQDQIQAFFSGRANPAFGKRVGIRGLDGSFDYMKAFGLENHIKGPGKRAIIVMD
jgi:hypothetical protein